MDAIVIISPKDHNSEHCLCSLQSSSPPHVSCSREIDHDHVSCFSLNAEVLEAEEQLRTGYIIEDNGLTEVRDVEITRIRGERVFLRNIPWLRQAQFAAV